MSRTVSQRSVVLVGGVAGGVRSGASGVAQHGQAHAPQVPDIWQSTGAAGTAAAQRATNPGVQAWASAKAMMTRIRHAISLDYIVAIARGFDLSGA